MKLILVDINHSLVEAWRAQWSQYAESEAEDRMSFPQSVSFEEGNILSYAEGALVSPANSFGLMDGGIDLVYRDFFGPEIEQKVQHCIYMTAGGSLDVGAARVVPTGHIRITHLIVAPTMQTPEPLADASHVGRAMWAVLREAYKHRNEFDCVYCPGLGTGVGRVPNDLAAMAMIQAIQDFRAQIKAR